MAAWQFKPRAAPVVPVKLASTVTDPVVVHLKTVPTRPVPPLVVVPYKLPSECWTNAAFGAKPVVLVRFTNVVRVPLGVILKIVPNAPTPPP